MVEKRILGTCHRMCADDADSVAAVDKVVVIGYLLCARVERAGGEIVSSAVSVAHKHLVSAAVEKLSLIHISSQEVDPALNSTIL